LQWGFANCFEKTFITARATAGGFLKRYFSHPRVAALKLLGLAWWLHHSASPTARSQ
jgi:hypothetical protein